MTIISGYPLQMGVHFQRTISLVWNGLFKKRDSRHPQQKMGSHSADSRSVEDKLGKRLGILENGLGDLEKRKTSDITLKGGDFWSSGNVFINGGPVCDDHWTSNEAMVVCKSLGFRMVRVTKEPCV